jgi:hypothetical protein
MAGWQDLDNPDYILRWKYKSEGSSFLPFLLSVALQTVFKRSLKQKK